MEVVVGLCVSQLFGESKEYALGSWNQSTFWAKKNKLGDFIYILGWRLCEQAQPEIPRMLNECNDSQMPHSVEQNKNHRLNSVFIDEASTHHLLNISPNPLKSPFKYLIIDLTSLPMCTAHGML